MRPEAIVGILRNAGVLKSRVVAGAGKVQIPCLFSRWTHPKGKDSRPSMVVYTGDDGRRPRCVCLACHHNDSLSASLLTLSALTGINYVPLAMAVDEGSPVDDYKFRKESLRKGLQPDVMKGLKAVSGPDQGYAEHMLMAQAEEYEEIPWSEYETYLTDNPPEEAKDFVAMRGLRPETCETWQLGVDESMKRILFPVKDYRGRLLGISGRMYVDYCLKCGGREWIQPPKDRVQCKKCGKWKPLPYLHGEGKWRNLLTYGEVRHSEDRAEDGRVYVVEGHLDMLLMWQFGYRPVVAIFGTYPGEVQIEKLVKLYDRIVVVPDGDAAGVIMGKKVKEMVRRRIPVAIRGLVADAPGEDPGSLLLKQRERFEEIVGPPTMAIAS